MNFRTHTGEIVEGERLISALAKVAADKRENAHALRAEDPYAAHVTEARKDEALREDLALADRIEAGEVKSFATWQRVNEALTGECVALFGEKP